MKRPPNIPKKSGVYALVTLSPVEALGTRVAYVGWCGNLQQRANMWQYRFRKRLTDPTAKLPAKGLPDVPGEGWGFLVWAGLTQHEGVEQVRGTLQQAGFGIINAKTRVREQVEYCGKIGTIAEHARTAGVPYTKAYYRWRAGKPLEEVFAADP